MKDDECVIKALQDTVNNLLTENINLKAQLYKVTNTNANKDNKHNEHSK